MSIEKKRSEWLSLPHFFENHREDIKAFVDCYFLFYGVAGKCHCCCAQDLCIGINVENGHNAPDGHKNYYRPSWGK